VNGGGTSRSGAFSTRVVVALLIVGVFSFSAFLTLSTFAPEFRRGDNGAAHALSRSAVGFGGAVRLAQASGVEVIVNRNPTGAGSDYLAVLTPTSTLTREALARLRGYATLIILPKWLAVPYERPGWVARLGALPEKSVAEIVSEVAPQVTVTRARGSATTALTIDRVGLTSGAIDQLQTISGSSLEPVIRTKEGRIVLARIRKESDTFILGDPDFLNTQGLANLDTARVGMAILEEVRSGGPLSFDVTLNGLETGRNLLRLALTPPLLGATMALLATAMLLAWRSVMQWGPRVRASRAIALGKRALAENSAALIRIAGREHTMGWRYAVLTAATAAEQIGAPRAEPTETFAMLDRVGATQGMSRSFSELASEAANARNPTEVATTARQLHAWTEEMMRATR
jgi:hypothetical protein